MSDLQNDIILQIMDKLDIIESEITELKIKVDKLTTLFNFFKPILVMIIVYIIFKTFNINLYKLR